MYTITVYLFCNNIKIFHAAMIGCRDPLIPNPKGQWPWQQKNGRPASDQVKEVHQKLDTSVM